MTENDWRMWNRNDSVELRTYLRATQELPEMESTKQLVSLLKKIWFPGISILDVGCAAGHYYHGIKRIGSDFTYTGVDPTDKYIEFARRTFAEEANAEFVRGDVFDLGSSIDDQYDVVFCCNVLLHLPTIAVPLKNLVSASRAHVIIRTLISDRTHISKLLYSDAFDEAGEPTDYYYQNTWSRDLIKAAAKDAGARSVEFIEDRYDPIQIQKENADFSAKQVAVTKVENGVQLSGSKVYEWEWVKIEK